MGFTSMYINASCVSLQSWTFQLMSICTPGQTVPNLASTPVSKIIIAQFILSQYFWCNQGLLFLKIGTMLKHHRMKDISVKIEPLNILHYRWFLSFPNHREQVMAAYLERKPTINNSLLLYFIFVKTKYFAFPLHLHTKHYFQEKLHLTKF